uniref:Phosphate transporter n=1 Tax=Schmidtea mediterranea TaxID=79327 RepID=A0A0H3YJ89_SCHMD|nr:slc20a-1 [Schmidtea mediterranea]
MLFPDNQIWIIVVGFLIAFILAFGIGANDVANSFGTSVGSKVLTLKQACVLASIFEILGSILLGAKVSDTIRKGVILPEYYNTQNMTDGIRIMMMGQLSSLSGACVWMMIATFFKLPVSGSHSIVGAVVGFALIIHGVKGIDWVKVGFIVASWFISPILSGSVSVLTFFIFDRFILKKSDPLEPGLTFLPFIYSITILINAFSIFISGPPLLGFDKIPLYGTFIASFGLAIITILVVRFVAVPYLRKKIQSNCSTATAKMSFGNGSSYVEDNHNLNGHVETHLDNNIVHIITKPKHIPIKDKPEQCELFSGLQILTAVFGGFAHGGNDVSNAIGPLVGLWIIGLTQDLSSKMAIPIWILLYGGFGITIGLWIWGRRVIKTMGDELTTITPSSGVCIELGSAITVTVASNIGLPISTTHCKVGSIVAVGRYRSNENVDWKIFRHICFAWFITLPVTGGVSALIMFCLKKWAV